MTTEPAIEHRSNRSEHRDSTHFPSLLATLVFTAAAGGMGWGIRGQYGHESGAMIAGVLIASVVALRFCHRYSSLFAARVVALTAIGISFGGAMTYGQTIGLTHDAELVGNWDALRWGMLGLALIGGLWLGFAGLMMGMALGGKRYRPLEVLLVFLFLMGLYLVGAYLLNEPFNPAARELPRLYFSDDWHWEPNKRDLAPRRECWGGMLAALAGLWLYVAGVKRDSLARNLALFGIAFGALGFPLGQSVQAYHAWNVDDFREGWFASIDPYMNWWNTMETIFGAVAGLGLGLGVWLNRQRLPMPPDDAVELSPATELVLLAAHAAAVAAWNFMPHSPVDRFADQSLFMGLLPIALTVGGRYSPYLIALPIVALPICGKTLRELSYYHEEIAPAVGWPLLVILPLLVLTVAAILLARRGAHGARGQDFARWTLLLSSWLYYALNFAFFRTPWPWQPPTSRTLSALVFTICLALLTIAALAYRPARRPAASGFAQG